MSECDTKVTELRGFEGFQKAFVAYYNLDKTRIDFVGLNQGM